MWMYSIFLFLMISICHLGITDAEYSMTGIQVSVRPKPEEQNRSSVFWSDSSTARAFSSPRRTDFTYTTGPKRPTMMMNTVPMTDSNCFCSYNQSANLVSCSPLLQTSSSFSVSHINNTLINVTINDCTFYSNHFSIPAIKGKMIDYLQLYDINRRDYLVFDESSFSSFSINQIYVFYSYTQPTTILLISTDTFSSAAIRSSLRTLYIDSCYLVTLNKPLASLFSLYSITLINIEQFSWSNFQQQIIHLPKLRYVHVGQDVLRATSDIFNVISCSEISSQWIFTYRFIQTCSCKLMTLLRTTRRSKTLFQCSNSEYTIDLISDVCQLNRTQYSMENQTDVFCKKCLSYSCSNGTACAEAPDLEPTCLFLSRYDYATIRSRVPLTPYTKQFLFQESQDYLTSNPNKTLQPSAFNAVATVLIQANQNQTEGSTSECQMFHQTFSEMLSRPWSSAIYSTNALSPDVTQQLLFSLDESVKSINDSDSQFVFQSEPLSTMSLRFPTDQILQSSFGWKITSDNQIISNVTSSDSFDKTVTSRVFLQFNKSQIYIPTCNTSNPNFNCTNRFSVTSIKAPKLFYNTDRIPSYDVISVVAPSQQQRVTFFFEQKLSSNITTGYLINSTNTTSDPFYDQLNVMISEGTCMYLNTTSMLWQTDGCTTDRQASNGTVVTCTCEHLTMFTVFFSLSCATPSKALDILSWIGCVLSTMGLLITLITFIVIRQCRRTQATTSGISSSHSSSSQELRRRIMGKPRHLSMVKSMLFTLCILLILMNIFILILTFVKSGRNLTCTILSASLYYITLTAFIWKFLFALQQSLFLTNIFQPYWSDRTLFLIYCIITFSLPICPLLVMFIKFEDFTFISSTCNYCWLTREFLLYGLIIPIVVIVCLNIVFYLYTMIHLCLRNRQQLGLRSTKSDHSRQLQNVKIGLFFAIIMGLSWILGFLVLIPNSYVQIFGNILFCLVNTFQGFTFSIMVFCMLERKSFRKCCCGFWRRSKPLKTTLNVASITPQLSLPASNDDHDKRMKTIYNSSIYTSSTTSGGDNQAPETLDHLSKKKSAAENDDEHIYSSPIF